jgi:hypothetical protein
MKSTIFLDITPWSQLKISQGFGDISPPSSGSNNKQGKIPSWKLVAFPINDPGFHGGERSDWVLLDCDAVKLVFSSKTARCHNPEKYNLEGNNSCSWNSGGLMTNRPSSLFFCENLFSHAFDNSVWSHLHEHENEDLINLPSLIRLEIMM